MSSYAALHWVTVVEDARRRGVGAYMVETAERIAKEAGCISIRADVYQDNLPMRALLSSYGYTFCGDIEIRSGLGRIKRRASYDRIW